VSRPLPVDRHKYFLFGLSVHSDRPIHGLVELDNSAAPDVLIRFVDEGTMPEIRPPQPPTYVSPFVDERGRPAAVGWALGPDAGFRIVMRDGPAFVIDPRGTRIDVDAGVQPAAHVSEYVVGPMLGLALRRRGVVCLHASAVDVGDGAAAFVGHSGSGKSTLAMAFAMRGCPIVTDDLAALTERAGRMHVYPGAGYLRARRGEAERLAAAANRLSDLRESPDPEYVDLSANANALPTGNNAVALRAVYVLDSSDAGAGARPITALTGHQAFMALAADTWGTRLLDPMERQSEFNVLTRLLAQVPVRHVAVQQASGLADALADAIERDLGQLAGQRID
jgi:hypothetical protein